MILQQNSYVKNFFLFCLIAISCLSIVDAREAMLPDPSVVVDTGMIEDSALLASPGGECFIEFSSSVKFVHEEGLISFSGEILPPATIEIPDQKPRLRMEALLSFELITDSGEPVLFADRFDLQNSRNRLREKYLNPETTTRSSWVKLIVPIENETVGRPRLWEYIGPDEGWAAIGGILDEPTPEGIRVFSAILHRTGVYTLFDEEPAPKHFANEFDGSMDNMNSSGIDPTSEEFWNESNGELPDGMTWEEIQSLTINGEIKSRDEWNNIAEVPEALISVNKRDLTASEKASLQARKLQLISQLGRTTEPKDILLLQELLTLIERKIVIAQQREQLVARKTQIEVSIPAAATEKLRSDFTDQLAIVNSQLENLKDVALEQRIHEIESSMHMTVEKKVIPIPAPIEIEIPEEAELPQSGAAGELDEVPSLVFPIALLFILLFVIGSGVVASRKPKY